MFEKLITTPDIKPEGLYPKEGGGLDKADPFKIPDIRDLPSKEDNISDFALPNVADLPPLGSSSSEIENVYKNLFSFLPTTGEWAGEVGNSEWKPDSEIKPDPENKKGGNPDNLTWEEILDKYGIDGIEYKDGYPDFSSVSVGEVTIEPFTESRDKNFRQADEKLAEQWTKEGKDGKEWTARDVAEWRKENGYTWHEHQDCKTMQLVPKEIHNNTPHSGGISEIKKQNSENNV
ncbi:HNH endonuclease [Ursidibacter arcticus]